MRHGLVEEKISVKVSRADIVAFAWGGDMPEKGQTNSCVRQCLACLTTNNLIVVLSL